MLVIGHRGAAAVAPENTIPSFLTALSARADGIECDVRLTADGHLVVMHDDETTRTTGVQGCVSEMTFEHVRALRCAPDVGVPSLEEVLAIERGGARLVLELKGAHCHDEFGSSQPVARAILSYLSDVRDVIVTSFDPSAVALARELGFASTAIVCHAAIGIEWGIDTAIADGHQECHAPQSLIDARSVARAHDAGLQLYAYTVNEWDRLRELRDLGVDGVFTDDPAGARAALS